MDWGENVANFNSDAQVRSHLTRVHLIKVHGQAAIGGGGREGSGEKSTHNASVNAKFAI